MPDPVGKAIATLVQRLDELEREVLHLRAQTFTARYRTRAPLSRHVTEDQHG